MIKKAIKLVEKGHYAQAEEILRVEIEKAPMHAEALFNLAVVRRALGDIGEAMELMEQAIKAQPRNSTLYNGLANMQLGVEDYDEAEKNFLKSTGLDPNNVHPRSGLAFLDIRQSRFKSAEHSLMIALNIEPDNVQALVFMGISLLEQGQHDNAIEYLQRAVKLEPENVQGQFCLGRALLAAGNSGFAVQCFENAVRAEPETAEFRDWLACAQLNIGNIAEAKENFGKAMDMGRVNTEVLTGLARAETLLGNHAEALNVMAQTVQFAPQRHELGLQYAEMLMEAGRFDEAISQLQSLQASGFEPEQVSLRLATALVRGGETEQALRTLEPLKSNNDISPETRLLLAWVLQECEDQEGVAGQLDILLSMDRPLLDAVLLRARQMYETGDDQVLSLLQQALKRDDINAQQTRQAQILLAHSLEQQGEYESAVVEYGGLADRPATVVQLAHQFHQGEAVAPAGNEAAVSAMDLSVTADWPNQPPEDNRGEVLFVFAWPGSGRNLLLSSLGHHPEIYFLPDSPEQQIARRTRLTDRVGAKALAQVDETKIRMGRRHYWKATGLDGQLAPGYQVIDSQWMNAEMLPAIARYFPGTSVIVLTREPRDMAITWMQTGYQDLEGMAALYQSQLDLLQTCKSTLPINFIEIDYDDLCAEPERELVSIQQALGLELDLRVVEHFNEEISRVPATSGVWENYKQGLESVFTEFK